MICLNCFSGVPSNGFGRASEKERQVGLPAVRTEGIGLCLLLVEGGSLICGSGKAGIPDGKSDRQLLAKKESYIKVRQVMGLDNASPFYFGYYGKLGRLRGRFRRLWAECMNERRQAGAAGRSGAKRPGFACRCRRILGQKYGFLQ